MKNDQNDMQAGIFPAETEQNVSTLLVANIMNQLMRPLLEDIGKLLKNNTEAMEQIAASQDVIRNRMEALEKQVRLCMMRQTNHAKTKCLILVAKI